MATFQPPCLENLASSLGLHPRPKSVHTLTTSHFGLPRSFRHTYSSLVRFTARNYTPFFPSLQVWHCLRGRARPLKLPLFTYTGASSCRRTHPAQPNPSHHVGYGLPGPAKREPLQSLSATTPRLPHGPLRRACIFAHFAVEWSKRRAASPKSDLCIASGIICGIIVDRICFPPGDADGGDGK